MPINNDWVNNKKKKVNMNFDNDESSKGIYIIFILGIVATYFLYGYIQEIKVKEQEQIKNEINAYNQSVREYNQKVLEQRQKEKLANQNNYYNTKNFKIKSQYREKNYNDVYNMTMIINNLDQVKSNINDNNYKIEISGRISSYGNMIYKIYRTNGNANIYDSKFTEVMEELKKYTFKVSNDDLDFNITIHNNSYNLN